MKAVMDQRTLAGKIAEDQEIVERETMSKR